MSYTLRALVSRASILSSLTSRLRGLRVASLHTPTRERALGDVLSVAVIDDDVLTLTWDRAADPVAGFDTLTSRIAAEARAASDAGTVAYLEADFRGGVGTQASIVWCAGEVVLGPLRASNAERVIGLPPLDEWPVNRALRYLGVHRDPRRDEFDALGLGRLHRDADIGRRRFARRVVG